MGLVAVWQINSKKKTFSRSTLVTIANKYLLTGRSQHPPMPAPRRPRLSLIWYVRTSLARRNSRKVTGNMLMIFTFPTGTVILRFLTATPNSEPAAIT